jgi:hypothetical protein
MHPTDPDGGGCVPASDPVHRTRCGLSKRPGGTDAAASNRQAAAGTSWRQTAIRSSTDQAGGSAHPIRATVAY